MKDDTRYIARATLDNIELPDEHDEIQFSDFVIRLCPNHAQPIPVEEEDGTVTDVDWQYPAKPDTRFPICDYYLEIPFTPVSSKRWKEAEDKLVWALNRLRLFKKGRLWGSLYNVFNAGSPGIQKGLEDIEALMRRRHTRAPSKGLWLGGFRNIYSVEENEVTPLTVFVEEMKNVPTKSFEVALRRFHQSFDRDLPDDQAVDLFIALESLFSEDREAIAYKIALRAACLLETEPKERKALFVFLKQAYSGRSKAVHGKSATSSWWTEGNLARLEGTVRKALRQLLQRAKHGMAVKAGSLDDSLFFSSSELA